MAQPLKPVGALPAAHDGGIRGPFAGAVRQLL